MARVKDIVRFKFHPTHVDQMLAAPGLDSAHDIASSHISEYGLLRISAVHTDGTVDGTMVVNHTTIPVSNAQQFNGFWAL